MPPSDKTSSIDHTRNGSPQPDDQPVPLELEEVIAQTLEETSLSQLPEHQEELAAITAKLAEAIAESRALPIPEHILLQDELSDLHSSREFIQLLRSKHVDVHKIKSVLQYEYELEMLQVELVKLQQHIQKNGLRLAILFEGRDAAGKGGAIRRFTEHLNPRSLRVVALPKPSQEEAGQWYFQRYIRHLPNPGEIVFFDRSWYNRAVVEPVNEFCAPEQYDQFMRQVPEFEQMLVEDGLHLVKFWFSISKEVQTSRFASRQRNPLKHWKFSPLDAKAQQLWDEYTRYKEAMFGRTHTTFSPWIIVQANKKKRARLESIRHVLSLFDYNDRDKAAVTLIPDPDVVMRFHRAALGTD